MLNKSRIDCCRVVLVIACWSCRTSLLTAAVASAAHVLPASVVTMIDRYDKQGTHHLSAAHHVVTSFHHVSSGENPSDNNNNNKVPQAHQQARQRHATSSSSSCSHEADACGDSNDCCDDLTCIKFHDQDEDHPRHAMCTRYEVTGRTLNGPRPTGSNTDMKFLAFGDSPYDGSADYPYEGAEYECLKDVILPGVQRLSKDKHEVDWIVHVGDIKTGGDGYDSDCDDTVFESRKKLFASVEPDLDFLLLPGDNEFSAECEGGTSAASDSDPVQRRWRRFFTKDEFRGLDKEDPQWGRPEFRRQEDYPENFFMYYDELDLVFFGITEPENEHNYNALNANFIQARLGSLSSKPNAIVLFGHSRLETSDSHDQVLDVLDEYSDVPMLYVMGNDHNYDMDFMSPSRLPKLMQLTVKAFSGAPLLVSIVDYDGDRYFHVEMTDYSC